MTQSVLQRAIHRVRAGGIVQLIVFAVRAIRWRFLALYRGYNTVYSGIRIYTYFNSISPKIQHAIRNEMFEANEIELLEKHLPSDQPVIELGAGIGVISCHINGLLDTSKYHIAIEANPRLIPALTYHRDINGCAFEIEQKAYSPNQESVEFYIHDEFVKGSTHRKSNTKQIVDGISLPKIFEKTSFEIATLVVDIEGGELGLIQSELNILKDRCEWLFIEFHDGRPELADLSEDFDAAIDSLENAGFKQIDMSDNVVVYRNSNQPTCREVET